MDARQWFKQAGQKIIDYFTGIEDDLFKLIVATLKEANYKQVEAADVLAWQTQQLVRINDLNLKAKALVKARGILNKRMVTDLVREYGEMTASEVDGELKRLGKTPQPSPEVEKMIEGLATQTWRDLNNNVNESLVSRNYGDSAVTKAYQQILKESTMASVTGQMTHEQAVNQALAKLAERGLPSKLVDRQGHTWSIEGYVRTVITTTANRTYNSVRMQRMKDTGTTLALMSAHPNSRPACAYIQGKVVNVVPEGHPGYDSRYDSIYNHGYGTPAGTLGINCRHVLTPFDPETMENHQPQYDPEKAIANGKLVQEQRARERAIRDAKKLLRYRERMNDKEGALRAKTLVRARQKKMREFIKETNAGQKTPILTRDYDREQIIANGRQLPKPITKRFAMDTNKQDAHIPGTKRYNEATKKRKDKQSYFTIYRD